MRFPSLLEHFVLVVNLTFVYVERPIAVVVWAYAQHIKIRKATLWPWSKKVEGGMRIDSAQFSGFTNYPLSSCSFPLSSVLAYLGFRISLSRARLRLSQFRIRLSLSWLSLSRAPMGLTFSLTMQKYKEKRCAPNFPSKIHLFSTQFFALILQKKIPAAIFH